MSTIQFINSSNRNADFDHCQSDNSNHFSPPRLAFHQCSYLAKRESSVHWISLGVRLYFELAVNPTAARSSRGLSDTEHWTVSFVLNFYEFLQRQKLTKFTSEPFETTNEIESNDIWQNAGSLVIIILFACVLQLFSLIITILWTHCCWFLTKKGFP